MIFDYREIYLLAVDGEWPTQRRFVNRRKSGNVMHAMKVVLAVFAFAASSLASAQALHPKTHREAVARAAEILEANGADLSKCRLKSEFLRDAFVVSLYPDPKEFSGSIPPKVPAIATVGFGYRSGWEPELNFTYTKVPTKGYGKALAAAMRYKLVEERRQGSPIDSVFTIGANKDGYGVYEVRLPLMIGGFTSYQLNKKFEVVHVGRGK